VARVLPNDLEPVQNRYTVIAGKKCGNAVERNRLKRLTREALRGYHPHLRPGHDIALVVRGNRGEMPTLEVAQETLLRIFRRANLFVADAEVPLPGSTVTAAWKASVNDEVVE
jgi:ribonuclease P protein component